MTKKIKLAVQGEITNVSVKQALQLDFLLECFVTGAVSDEYLK